MSVWELAFAIFLAVTVLPMVLLAVFFIVVLVFGAIMGRGE